MHNDHLKAQMALGACLTLCACGAALGASHAGRCEQCEDEDEPTAERGFGGYTGRTAAEIYHSLLEVKYSSTAVAGERGRALGYTDAQLRAIANHLADRPTEQD